MSEYTEETGSLDKKQADQSPSGGAGEDEGSTAVDGKDDHLKEDQKPTTK